IAFGADGLETDCWLIEDGEVVIHHDKAVQSQVIGQDPINISKMSLKEIKKVTLPNGEKILTLHEFFEKYADRKSLGGKKLQFSIDLQDIAVGSAIIPLLKRFNVLDNTVLCGNATLILRRVRKKSNEVRLVASNLQDQITQENLLSESKITKLKLDAFNIQGELFKPEMQEVLIEANMKCYIWDLNSESDLKKFMSFKPDAIFSDFPDIAIKIRESL
ncbi:MAG: hypothetical protein GY870_19655, partial [archaeon]|nr:hypothetical protein [archaeon]